MACSCMDSQHVSSRKEWSSAKYWQRRPPLVLRRTSRGLHLSFSWNRERSALFGATATGVALQEDALYSGSGQITKVICNMRVALFWDRKGFTTETFNGNRYWSRIKYQWGI
jgi:hypothetical protein